MSLSARKARLIAFYLPQFHPIPENDEWWGKGFTEWTNVTKAKPLFPGHYQPHIPTELGYYDLRVPETRQAQAELAQQYGIEGFCYWHYWFNGRRLLERPFQEVLTSGEPKLPFCLAWANESWTGIWYDAPNKILVEQTYPGLEDYQAHFEAIKEAFFDDRYIKVDGKPIFIVYRPQKIPDPKLFCDYWRELADKAGLPGLYLMGVIITPHWLPEQAGFDASIPINPDFSQGNYRRSLIKKKPRRSTVLEALSALDTKITLKRTRNLPHIYCYEESIRHAFLHYLESQSYPCIFSNWDNTPRSRVNGRVFLNSTPELFRIHLRDALNQVAQRPDEQKLIFVRSWNEWAEGNYLEPEQKYGRGFLEVIRDEVIEEPS